ncbi:MAG: energy transducer TonB [Acidobacteria bacterium]|nr:energy transducer TonB [Acidobacteriota bacterium]
MISTTHRNETDRGAETGPPVAVAEPVENNTEIRLGPLPEPTLLERLRASWSLDALVPSFAPDPSMPPRRGFRIAGALALGLHIVILTTIVLFGRYAIMEFHDTDPPPEDYVWVKPDEFRPADAPGKDAASNDSGGPEGGAPGDSGGSNVDPKPATGGVLPRPVPVSVPLNLPPPVAPASLPVDPGIAGPDLPVPPPTGDIGLPGAPEAPGDPSAGGNGGRGIGNGPGGDGAGSGNNPGTGPGGHTGKGPGPGGTRDGVTPGGGGTGSTGPGGGVQNRNIRLVAKARPVIPRKMIETQTFGTVTLSVTIGADGSVLKVVPVNTLSGGGTQAAIDAVYRCRFSPAIRNGVAVTETTMVHFEIREK